jgi:GNAT superfamily N-acetyltransferase
MTSLDRPSVEVRPAREQDSAFILSLIKELAIYEKAEEAVVATEAHIKETIFGPDSIAHGLICNVEGQAVGFAVYFYNYSTWLGKNGLFLEDLYVTPEYRGAGAGKALLKYLAQLAVEKGCGRFEWNVLDWNTPAIEFYENFGAEPQSEWVGYRLEGSKLTDFANN